MKILLASIAVDDQEKALAFYTQVLGFEKKLDLPLGGEHRWLTVISAEGHDDVELLLEPLAFEPARVYQEALREAGIPGASFAVADIAAEHQRLAGKGVVFRSEPTDVGGTRIAVFEDTCGNLVQIYEG